MKQGKLRRAFHSPFRPFVLMTASIGAEDLDFHLYCNRLAHYVLPGGEVQLEQKNGRIDRRNSLVVRRYKYEHRAEDCSAGKLQSGGMCPDWFAGVGNLHDCYFLTKHTGEKHAYEELRRKMSVHQKSLGIFDGGPEESLNLSPFLKENAEKGKQP